MNRRLTLILFLIFAALAVLAWSLRDESARQVGPGAPTPTPGPMWDLAASAVDKVEVAGGSGSYVLSKVDGAWQVDNQAASDEVAGTVERVAGPTVIRALPDDRDPATYGFATPTLTVTFTVSGTARTLLVGDTLATSETDRYVKPADGTTIYAVSGFDFTKLSDWLTAPPLAPTATATATPAASGTPGTAAPDTTGTPAAADDAGAAPAAAASGTAEPTATE